MLAVSYTHLDVYKRQPIDIQANVSEITQAEAYLYDLENYDVPGLIELPINVKANLQIQSDIEEKQSEIEALKAGLLNEDGTINLEVQAEISQAETDLAILQARLAALEQPTPVSYTHLDVYKRQM